MSTQQLMNNAINQHNIQIKQLAKYIRDINNTINDLKESLEKIQNENLELKSKLTASEFIIQNLSQKIIEIEQNEPQKELNLVNILMSKIKPQLIGVRGPTGDKGQTGDKGSQGEQGLRGDQGPPGNKGPRGDQGKIGPRGPKGPDGEMGIEGDKGPRGEQGYIGEKGPYGEQGLQGEQG